MLKQATWRWAGLVLLLILLVGCGGPSAPEAVAPTPSLLGSDGLALVDPATVSGGIEITGSSTVYPLTARMAEDFAADGSSAQIDIKITGTGGGLRSFCNGDPFELINASRMINEEEISACRAQGREPVGFQVGIDALAVVVNPANRFVDALNYAQLAAIFSGQAQTWADLDPTFPAEPIAIYSPGVDSGTFDYFVEAILDGESSQLLDLPGALLSEDDLELVQGIEENANAIGYFGFAYYFAESERLRAVPIDGGSGSVVPGADSVADGSYPLARPLFLYTSPNVLRDHPAAAAFLSYYLQHVDEVIAEVGYFPVSSAVTASSQQALVQALR
ncbi:MAG: PstS family phosphate ABC transporter substrate-binding protein [Candidatus Viridilinea halotolerans]|uniref:Phosphate-binding protein n=1 Tax=Candidatus Viridilinea halotolerans TaxID=2491704 RepID=A0A426U159_9CHLR|nr:MAG: PstS family phosphate ABC transporter substrate-binding protein [Candidatus Viridilinea halotolerans]